MTDDQLVTRIVDVSDWSHDRVVKHLREIDRVGRRSQTFDPDQLIIEIKALRDSGVARPVAYERIARAIGDSTCVIAGWCRGTTRPARMDAPYTVEPTRESSDPGAIELRHAEFEYWSGGMPIEVRDAATKTEARLAHCRIAWRRIESAGHDPVEVLRMKAALMPNDEITRTLGNVHYSDVAHLVGPMVAARIALGQQTRRTPYQRSVHAVGGEPVVNDLLRDYHELDGPRRHIETCRALAADYGFAVVDVRRLCQAELDRVRAEDAAWLAAPVWPLAVTRNELIRHAVSDHPTLSMSSLSKLFGISRMHVWTIGHDEIEAKRWRVGLRQAYRRGDRSWPTPEAQAQALANYSGCVYCGVDVARNESDGLAHLDHVWPHVLGGPDDPTNLVPSCASCNLAKGAKPLREWLREPSVTITARQLAAQIKAATGERAFFLTAEAMNDAEWREFQEGRRDRAAKWFADQGRAEEAERLVSEWRLPARP